MPIETTHYRHKTIPQDTPFIMLGFSAGQEYHTSKYLRPLLDEVVLPACVNHTGINGAPTKFIIMLFDDVQGKTLRMRGLANAENEAEKGRTLGDKLLLNIMEVIGIPNVLRHCQGTYRFRDVTTHSPELSRRYHEALVDFYGAYGAERGEGQFGAVMDKANLKVIERMGSHLLPDSDMSQAEKLGLSTDFTIMEFAAISALKSIYPGMLEIYNADEHLAAHGLRTGHIQSSFPLVADFKTRRFIRTKYKGKEFAVRDNESLENKDTLWGRVPATLERPVPDEFVDLLGQLDYPGVHPVPATPKTKSALKGLKS